VKELEKMKLQNSRVLVTGGAGFIGSHLCERLIQLRAEVVSLDNYFTGKLENHVDGVTYLEGSTENINELFVGDFDIVFHLGEYSRVEQSFADVELVWRFNRLGTHQVIEFCAKNKIKLIYAGSSTKYGDGGLGRTQSPYAWSKASNTELIINYGAWFGLEYAITYFYNVYGGREIKDGPYATLIGIFSERKAKGKKLLVVEPGTQERNFTHVDDIIDALILIGEKGSGDEFGIGSDEGYSVLKVAEMFDGDIQFIPPRRGNRMSAAVMTQKTKKLGWSPKRKLSKYIIDKK
jgi:UDP-glucose 4-epimerase